MKIHVEVISSINYEFHAYKLPEKVILNIFKILHRNYFCKNVLSEGTSLLVEIVTCHAAPVKSHGCPCFMVVFAPPPPHILATIADMR